MLVKLQKLLNQNNCEIFLKYDGERNKNYYTLKIIYNDLNILSDGKDTDKPLILFKKLINKENTFNRMEINKLYINIFKNIFKNIIKKFGNNCIIILKIKEGKENIKWILKINSNYECYKYFNILDKEFDNILSLLNFIKNLKVNYTH